MIGVAVEARRRITVAISGDARPLQRAFLQAALLVAMKQGRPWVVLRASWALLRLDWDLWRRPVRRSRP